MSSDVNIDISRRGRGNSLVRLVEPDRYRRLENACSLSTKFTTLCLCSLTKPIELIYSSTNLTQYLCECILLISIYAQQWVDHSLEEGSSCGVCVEDADG